MSTALPITQHQNGFLKVALPLGGRLHIWSPWNPPVAGDADVHDHPFEFTSLVLAGEMVNTHLTAVDDEQGDHVELTTACVTSFGPQPMPTTTERRVRLVETGANVIRRGELYKMSPWLLHRTDAVFALTLFRKGRQEEGHSKLYARRGVAVREHVPAHPNLLKLSLDRALAMARLTLEDVVAVEAMQYEVTIGAEVLSRLPLEPTPGYHLRTIPRSPHGTAAKIVEEALELADAVDQDAQVMALCECADLVSAVRGYLRRAGGEWGQVIKMADVTERAFSVGHRKERI